MRNKARGIPRVWTFVVVGAGPFPIDMLRYDLAYPKSESNASLIESTFQPRNRATHSVTLVSSKRPTEERWGSFGWAVESVE